jgi:hypothetical protein
MRLWAFSYMQGTSLDEVTVYAGTYREARGQLTTLRIQGQVRLLGTEPEMVNVPTKKAELIKWLNAKNET